MAQHKRFNYQSPEQLQTEMGRLGVKLELDFDLTAFHNPVKIGSRSAPNAFVIQPMEGRDADKWGRPTPLTYRRYERYAQGGAGLIWFEAVAVWPRGRSSPRQMFLSADNKESLKELLARTHQATAEYTQGHRPLCILQLQDAGRYRKGEGTKPALLVPNPYLDPPEGLGNVAPLTDGEIKELEERMVEAAKLAWQMGFDGVDIKTCHRYLGSEFLAAFTRTGIYGGSFANRTRFLFNVLQGIQAAVDKDFLLTVRMNLYDGIPYPYGWGVNKEQPAEPDLEEPIRLAGLLAERGVSILNTSNGCPYYNPHLTRPYDQPLPGAEPPCEHPLVGVARAVAVAGEVQRAHPDLIVVGTGYSYLRQFFPYVAATNIKRGAVRMVGLGRMAFAYPDFPRDIKEKGELERGKVCITCSRCTYLMRTGKSTGCVIRDSKIYKLS